MKEELGVKNAAGPLFSVGETVYSALAPDERGMVIVVAQNSNGWFYEIAWASDHTHTSAHHAIELSREALYHQPTR